MATVVNATAFSTTLPTGGTWSVDFNPTVDRIRFVHTGGSSFRLNQLNGTLAATDTPVAAARPSAVAYDRSTAPAPAKTTLFSIDGTASTLNLIGEVDGAPSPTRVRPHHGARWGSPSPRNGSASTLRPPVMHWRRSTSADHMVCTTSISPAALRPSSEPSAQAQPRSSTSPCPAARHGQQSVVPEIDDQCCAVRTVEDIRGLPHRPRAEH